MRQIYKIIPKSNGFMRFLCQLLLKIELPYHQTFIRQEMFDDVATFMIKSIKVNYCRKL